MFPRRIPVSAAFVFMLVFPAACSVPRLGGGIFRGSGAEPTAAGPRKGSGENSSDYQRSLERLRLAEDLYRRGKNFYWYGDMASAQWELERAVRLIDDLQLECELDSASWEKLDELEEKAGKLKSWVEGLIEARALSRLELSERGIPPAVEEPGGPEISYDIKPVYNARVQAYIDIFCGPNRDRFEFYLRRSGKYLEKMKKIFASEGLPEDLVYVALIESGFNPHAYSWAHAAGPWQFIRSTARIFGLKVNWWLDERRDPEKSCRAAAKYLKSLYRTFKSWPLALAAYNAGAGKVKRAIRRAGTRDFWKLKLPRQTRRYVPKFMAALIIAKNPDAFGFNIKYHEPEETDVVYIPQCTDLSLIARCAGCTVKDIKRLNPELRRWCTPPGIRDYRLYLPKGCAEVFWANYAKIPRKALAVSRRYRVKKGDTLSGIAYRFGTTVRAILDTNHLANRHRIHVGQNLIIPSSSGLLARRKATGSTRVSDVAFRDGGRGIVHTVMPRDTLYDIARQYNVTVADLKRWNKIRRGDLIKPGDRLKILASNKPETNPGGSPSDEGEYPGGE